MERGHFLEMLREVVLDHARKHRQSVLAALAAADRDLVRREVEVLDAQPAAFQESKARSVEQERNQAWHAIHAIDHRPDLVAREHGGKVLRALGSDQVVEPRQLDVENLAIEEQERVEGLVLGRGRKM